MQYIVASVLLCFDAVSSELLLLHRARLLLSFFGSHTVYVCACCRSKQIVQKRSRATYSAASAGAAGGSSPSFIPVIPREGKRLRGQASASQGGFDSGDQDEGSTLA